ncbi:hypothetical protein F5148DRAFT_1252108 [Russula earlei]|uniref:Uncharacterized protein n=1 Tax=Russula earlei TaxID=71964 RepID=A0ACC0TTL6_9AGAM|nr:hypothetical protein F5148DRAFT_1252108 [Russula earlei]
MWIHWIGVGVVILAVRVRALARTWIVGSKGWTSFPGCSVPHGRIQGKHSTGPEPTTTRLSTEAPVPNPSKMTMTRHNTGAVPSCSVRRAQIELIEPGLSH